MSTPAIDFSIESAVAYATAPKPSASTGPRTEEGKSISSRNAAKHNLTSSRLTGSDLNELNALRAKLNDDWQPTCETERLLLEQMALSQWRIDRALSLELTAFNDDHLDEKLLSLALRYRTAAERAFYKALAELQRLRMNVKKHDEKEAWDSGVAFQRALDCLLHAPIAPKTMNSSPAPRTNVGVTSSPNHRSDQPSKLNPTLRHPLAQSSKAAS